MRGVDDEIQASSAAYRWAWQARDCRLGQLGAAGASVCLHSPPQARVHTRSLLLLTGRWTLDAGCWTLAAGRMGKAPFSPSQWPLLAPSRVDSRRSIVLGGQQPAAASSARGRDALLYGPLGFTPAVRVLSVCPSVARASHAAWPLPSTVQLKDARPRLAEQRPSFWPTLRRVAAACMSLH